MDSQTAILANASKRLGYLEAIGEDRRDLGYVMRGVCRWPTRHREYEERLGPSLRKC